MTLLPKQCVTCKNATPSQMCRDRHETGLRTKDNIETLVDYISMGFDDMEEKGHMTIILSWFMCFGLQ